MSTTSDNVYGGGIVYSTPNSISAATASVGGGFSFDLPLATVAAFNQQGLDFVAANTTNNRGFFSSIFDTSNAAMDKTEDRAFSLAQQSLDTVSNIAYSNMQIQQQMNQFNQEQATIRADMVPEPASSGWCFITTAICEFRGESDDCEMLTVFRAFRDNVMLRNKVLTDCVAEYYRVAPDVVRTLKCLPDGGAAIFSLMYHKYLLPAFDCLKSDQHFDAFEIYAAMFEFAKLESSI